MKGNSFCYSSYSSFKLILGHIDTSIMVSAVTTASEILGKFTISLGLTAVAVVCMTYIEYFKNNLSSYLFPALVILVISYIITALFMSVFEVGVETIYLSYLIDEQVHGGEAVFSTGTFSQIKRREEAMVDHIVSAVDDEDEHLTTAI